MTNQNLTEAKELIDRIGRMGAADGWNGDINPTQRAALAYLARANRFSRAPSHAADYLCATRGTVSQTLKALARKGLIVEQRSTTDKRSISYAVTDIGQHVLTQDAALDAALKQLPPAEVAILNGSLQKLVKGVLQQRAGRTFGLCRTCRYHETNANGARCALLDVDLRPFETNEICHEHEDQTSLSPSV